MEGSGSGKGQGSRSGKIAVPAPILEAGLEPVPLEAPWTLKMGFTDAGPER